MAVIDLVTGFLGAGKTTFIRRYVQWLKGKGLRFAIIENEFGQAGIDAALLQEEGASIREISGGCVCCTLKLGLHDLLLELSDAVERIILEPSGLFNGADFLDILHSPQLEGKISPGIWLGILDPHSVANLDELERRILQTELIHAGSVALSKAQLSTTQELEEAQRFVEQLLPANPPTIFSEAWPDDGADAERCFSAIQAAGTCVREHTRQIIDHSLIYQSTTLRIDSNFREEQLLRILSSLGQTHFGKILRIKGFLKADTGETFAINYAPGSISVEKTQQTLPFYINVIGKNLQRKAIKAAFAQSHH